MRPTAKSQSAFRSPLNAILGTEAAVRVLRVLALSNDPLSRAEVAKQSGLHASGIPRVLTNLEDQGVVETIGQGHSRPVRLRHQHHLVQGLRQLFQEERSHVTRVLGDIKLAVGQLTPVPAAAWIEGPVATEQDVYTDPIVVGVLAESPESQGWSEQLRQRFNPLQRQWDVAIEARVRWRADIVAGSDDSRAKLRTVAPLLGPPPLDALGLSVAEAVAHAASRKLTHDMHDATARRYAAAIARHIRAKPGLVDETIQYLERRIPGASAAEALELQEWLDILRAYSPGRLRSFLVRDSEQATRLRQSLPFVHVLSEGERQALRRETEAEPLS
ncbi:MAG: helix-turn-helix domain-containing protein [Gemmatimonadaceae bacterium]